MRTIIAGSRGINDYAVVAHALSYARLFGIEPTSVLSGGARGVDRLGEMWAETYDLPVHRYPAKWNEHGKRAGYLRNEEMARNADALVAVWDGSSRGTRHMIEIAERMGLLIYVRNEV